MFGQIILTASFMEIVIMAPLASLVFHKLGPVLLKKAIPVKKEPVPALAADSTAVEDLLSQPVRFEDTIFERQQAVSTYAAKDSLRFLHNFD
jgi:hypothetical protein